jgi:hypothetical protein
MLAVASHQSVQRPTFANSKTTHFRYDDIRIEADLIVQQQHSHRFRQR